MISLLFLTPASHNVAFLHRKLASRARMKKSPCSWYTLYTSHHGSFMQVSKISTEDYSSEHYYCGTIVVMQCKILPAITHAFTLALTLRVAKVCGGSIRALIQRKGWWWWWWGTLKTKGWTFLILFTSIFFLLIVVTRGVLSSRTYIGLTNYRCTSYHWSYYFSRYFIIL